MLAACALTLALGNGWGCCPSNPTQSVYLFDVASQVDGSPAIQMMVWKSCANGDLPWVVGTTYPGAPTFPMGACDVLVPDPVLGANLMAGQGMWSIWQSGAILWLVESELLREEFPAELMDQPFTFQVLFFDPKGLAGTSNPLTVSVYS